MKKTSAAGECPSGQAKDCAGVCYLLKECKASISAQPGTCTQSEKYSGWASGQIKDWAQICFKENEAKACPTCVPGSTAAAEKQSTSPQAEKSISEKMKEASTQCHSGSYARLHLKANGFAFRVISTTDMGDYN